MLGSPDVFVFQERHKSYVLLANSHTLLLAKDGTHSLSAAEILRKHFGLPPPPKLKEASKRFGHKILETVSKSEQWKKINAMEKTWYFDVWNKVGCVSKRCRVVAWSLAESISGLPGL